MTTHKRCFRCGLVLPLSRFWRKSGSADGYHASCALCLKTKVEPEHIRLGRSQLKRCRICEQVKPFDDFHNHAGHYDGKANECRDCRQDIRNSDKWKERHALRAQGKKRCVICKRVKPFADFYSQPRTEYNTDDRTAICKLCTNERRRKDYVRRSHQYKDWATRWRKDNPKKRRAIYERYRCNKKQAEGDFSAADIERLYEAQNGLCTYHSVNPTCLVDLSHGYHVDHVIPLSRNGSNFPDNLQLLCVHCNTSKRDRTDTEFREWLQSL